MSTRKRKILLSKTDWFTLRLGYRLSGCMSQDTPNFRIGLRVLRDLCSGWPKIHLEGQNRL